MGSASQELTIRSGLLCCVYSSNSGTGTCTCTCETKPVSAADNQQKSKPNSASLIRTAARKQSAESQQGTAVDEAEAAEEGSNVPITTNEQNPKTPASENSDESLSSAAKEVPQSLSNAVETQQLINGCVFFLIYLLYICVHRYKCARVRKYTELYTDNQLVARNDKVLARIGLLSVTKHRNKR